MPNQPGSSNMLSVRDALDVLVQCRRDDQIVITNQGAARVWPLLATHALDFHYNPSAMGGAVPLALGLALACPQHEVVVVSGDGALLMSLGSLVSVVAARIRSLTVIVLENGTYEVTGGQRTAGALAGFDFAAAANSAGFAQARCFDQLASWRDAWPAMLEEPGPRFVCLRVGPADPRDLASTPLPMAPQIQRLSRELDR